MQKLIFPIVAALTLGGCFTAPEPEPHIADIAVGGQVAQDICAGCHAVGPTGASPVAAAPAFRTILANYDAADLKKNLQDATHISHPRMPQIFMSDAHIEDLIAYLESIQAK